MVVLGVAVIISVDPGLHDLSTSEATPFQKLFKMNHNIVARPVSPAWRKMY